MSNLSHKVSCNPCCNLSKMVYESAPSSCGDCEAATPDHCHMMYIYRKRQKMKPRDIFACLASCFCILGLFAIFWTLLLHNKTNKEINLRNDGIIVKSPQSQVSTLDHSGKISSTVEFNSNKICISPRKCEDFWNFFRTKLSNVFGIVSVHTRPTSSSDSKTMGSNRDADGHLPLKQQLNLNEFENAGTISIQYSIDFITNVENRNINNRKKRDSSGGNFVTSERSKKTGQSTDSQLQLINLATPNPDMEITIEVIAGELEDDEGWSLHSKGPLRNAPGISIAGSQTTIGGKQRGRRKKGDGPKRSPEVKEDIEGDHTEEPSAIGIGLLDLMRHTNFELEQEPPEQDFQSDWTRWSPCSVSCGGGRKERSRSCGFSCTTTESQDCNRDPCPADSPSTELLGNSTSPLLTLSHNYPELDTNEFERDSCEEWMSCRSERLLSYLARLDDLPACPCTYPAFLEQNNAIWDHEKHQMFNWIDKNHDEMWFEIYKKSAKYCIQSLLSTASTSLATQQCCYDDGRNLITRGPGAGTPHLISSEISQELNFRIDVMPWIICKGDWTKYNQIRPPDNSNRCGENPSEEKYQQYISQTTDF